MCVPVKKAGELTWGGWAVGRDFHPGAGGAAGVRNTVKRQRMSVMDSRVGMLYAISKH